MSAKLAFPGGWPSRSGPGLSAHILPHCRYCVDGQRGQGRPRCDGKHLEEQIHCPLPRQQWQVHWEVRQQRYRGLYDWRKSEPVSLSTRRMRWQLTVSSPLGLFAPGFKELGHYFQRMTLDIEGKSRKLDSAQHMADFYSSFRGIWSHRPNKLRTTGRLFNKRRHHERHVL